MEQLDYKNIHIGYHIKHIMEIRNESIYRASSFLNCNPQDILHMYTQKTIDSGVLLRWCKLLEYNFFMFYHSHLQIYAPLAATTKLKPIDLKREDKPYVFRKNLYSTEVISWLLDKLDKGELTPKEVIGRYNIPRTTIYRWIRKRSNKEEL